MWQPTLGLVALCAAALGPLVLDGASAKPLKHLKRQTIDNEYDFIIAGGT
jgi:hypothetical protein